MTGLPIIQRPPGAELDAYVAERVMGFKRSPYSYPYGMTWFGSDGFETSWYQTEYGSAECDPFNPSEDISVAEIVVEKFQKEGVTVSVQWCYDKGKPFWQARIADCLAYSYYSAAHAVCIAALNAAEWNGPPSSPS